MSGTPIKGSDGLKGHVIIITPQLAKEILKHRKIRNRGTSTLHIHRLATAMKNGEWVIADPILVNCDGSLIDGQHRLKAVIQANLPIGFLVIEGYDPESTFGRIGASIPRRLADWLFISGEARPDVMARVVRMAWLASVGCNPFATGSGRRVLTGPMGMVFLDDHPYLRESVTAAPGSVNRLLPQSMCAYLHSVFAQLDKTLADVFFVDLVMRDEDVSEGDPIYILRERLKSNRNARDKFPKPLMAALVIKAWNAVRTGESVIRLQWQPGKGEPFPVAK
jgi:hypothetical protein